MYNRKTLIEVSKKLVLINIVDGNWEDVDGMLWNLGEKWGNVNASEMQHHELYHFTNMTFWTIEEEY